MRTPRQQRSQATVDALLEATARILERDGVAGLTTNHVAALAGVSIAQRQLLVPIDDNYISPSVDLITSS